MALACRAAGSAFKGIGVFLHSIEQYQDFTYKASGSAVAAASPDAVWNVVRQIGGENRYFVLNSLWTIREWLDAAVGGPGLQRVRTVSGDPRPGDRIDSWEVIAAEAGRRLALKFNMKAPGLGVLEFLIEPRGDSRVRLTATAHWEPDGMAGLLYWRAMQPAHLVLFDRLTSEICRRAERQPTGSQVAQAPAEEQPPPAAQAASGTRS